LSHRVRFVGVKQGLTHISFARRNAVTAHLTCRGPVTVDEINPSDGHERVRRRVFHFAIERSLPTHHSGTVVRAQASRCDADSLRKSTLPTAARVRRRDGISVTERSHTQPTRAHPSCAMALTERTSYRRRVGLTCSYDNRSRYGNHRCSL